MYSATNKHQTTNIYACSFGFNQSNKLPEHATSGALRDIFNYLLLYFYYIITKQQNNFFLHRRISAYPCVRCHYIIKNPCGISIMLTRNLIALIVNFHTHGNYTNSLNIYAIPMAIHLQLLIQVAGIYPTKEYAMPK